MEQELDSSEEVEHFLRSFAMPIAVFAEEQRIRQQPVSKRGVAPAIALFFTDKGPVFLYNIEINISLYE